MPIDIIVAADDMNENHPQFYAFIFLFYMYIYVFTAIFLIMFTNKNGIEETDANSCDFHRILQIFSLTAGYVS